MDSTLTHKHLQAMYDTLKQRPAPRPVNIVVHIKDALELLRKLRKAGMMPKRVPNRSWWQVYESGRKVADVYVSGHPWMQSGKAFYWANETSDNG